MKLKKDYTRDFDLILNEITKRLLESVSVEDYYESSKASVLEYLDSSKSFPYQSKLEKSSNRWAVQYKSDPPFIISLVSQHSKYWVLDFYFLKTEKTGEVSQSFDKQEKGLEGIHYLDTLCKVLLDEILPIFEKSDISTIYFNAYNKDGNGDQRKAIFTKIISKFKLKNNYRVEEEGFEFKLYKK